MGKPLPTREGIRRAFAETVRALRQKRGISQEQLALLSGVDRGYVGALERGVHSPMLDTVFKLLPHLGVTAPEFARALERTLEASAFCKAPRPRLRRHSPAD